jgi:hypothetical protein
MKFITYCRRGTWYARLEPDNGCRGASIIEDGAIGNLIQNNQKKLRMKVIKKLSSKNPCCRTD